MIFKHLQKLQKIFQERNKIYVCKKIAVYLYQDKGNERGARKDTDKMAVSFN